jgi:hypothetical protein
VHFCLSHVYNFTLLLPFAYHINPALAEYQQVYSTLLSPPAVQTCCSEGEDGLKFFKEEFYVVRCPGCCFCGVMESSVVPFHMRVVLVFRDIMYVINILYSWYLVICEHFWSVCVEQLIWTYIWWVLGFGIKARYDIRPARAELGHAILRWHRQACQSALRAAAPRQCSGWIHPIAAHWNRCWVPAQIHSPAILPYE